MFSQNVLYMQMSHHYRRLLNAKSNIDSCQPHSVQVRALSCRAHSKHLSYLDSSESSSIEELSPSNMALVDAIVYDDKHAPDVIYRDHLTGKWNHNHEHNTGLHHHSCTEPNKVEGHQKQTHKDQQICTKRIFKKMICVPCDLLDRHHDKFEPSVPHKPRILKSNAHSRVRELKVYHPPRRKPQQWKTDDWDIETEVQNQQEVAMVADKWLQNQVMKPETEPSRTICAECRCDILREDPSSKVSIASRDSAYNGGVSSGGESRGPTPEQVNLTGITTRPINRVDARYAEFCQKITADILDHDILSDKEIKNVFHKHIQKNLEQLDMALMQKEIDELRVQLGITENGDNNEDPLFHWREIISTESFSDDKNLSVLPLSNSNVLSRITTQPVSSLNTSKSESLLSCDIRYPPCPAPRFTKYNNPKVQNKFMQTITLQSIETTLVTKDDAQQLLQIQTNLDEQSNEKSCHSESRTTQTKSKNQLMIPKKSDDASIEVTQNPDSGSSSSSSHVLQTLNYMESAESTEQKYVVEKTTNLNENVP